MRPRWRLPFISLTAVVLVALGIFLPLTSASASLIDGGSIGTTGVSWTIEDNGGLKTLNITGTGTPSDHPWTNSVAAQQIEAVHMDSTVQPKSMNGWFYGLSGLQSLDNSTDWDTSQVEDMSAMFAHCANLESTTIDVSTWDTSKVTNMYAMFQDCPKLEHLDLRGLDFDSVTSMTSMFYQCIGLLSVDASSWHMGANTNLYSMFAECTSLESVNVSGWDVSHVTNTYNLFDKCHELTTVTGLDTWNTSNLENSCGLFGECKKLTTASAAGVEGWNMSHITDMSSMFYGCEAVTSLDLIEHYKCSLHVLWL